MRQVVAAAVLALALACAGDREEQRLPVRAPPPAPDAGAMEAPRAPALPALPENPDAGGLVCAPAEGDAVTRLRADLRELGRVHWDSARHTAAKALCTLATGLEEVPPPRAAPELTESLRARAALLNDVERLPFRHSAHVRAGLEAALDALEELASAHGLEGAAPWLVNARRSVALVDPDGLFELQRAAIQDAFRTVSAAFSVVVAGARKTAAPGSPASDW